MDKLIRGLGGVFVLMFFLGFLSPLAWADGIIIPDPIKPIPHPELAIKYHHVNVSIDDQYAETRIDQVFLNEYSYDLEGTYIFPLPEDASISKFSMYVDGEELRGEVMEKDKARQIYEDIVRRMKDPALLEYIDRDTFKARVYPIPANGEKRVGLEYSEVIGCDSGVCKYVYPLEVEKFSSKPLETVVIRVKLESNKPINSVYSPTHDISVTRIDDFNVEVTYEEENVWPDKDFVLYYTVSEEDFGVNLLTYREGGEDGFFMLMLSPKYEIGEGEVIAKDVVLVLDSSGSMSGEKIEQARDALRFCVNNLNEEDRFNIITFSDSVDKFSDGLADAGSSNKGDALDFVSDIKAIGGTNINDALKESLVLLGGNKRPALIIFLTDGKPTVGVTEVEKILDNVGDANTGDVRVFVFGVGYDVNTHLLDKLSARNRGVSEYVEPEEDIEVKVSGFYAKVSNPVLSDVMLMFDGVRVGELYPKELPDLFKGSQLILLGRYEDGGDAVIRLKGNVGDESREYVYELGFPSRNPGNDFIPRLWATRKIGYLLDQIRLSGREDRELVDSIINLSVEYGIMTPYTSFLVDLDTDLTRPAAMEKARGGFWDSLAEEAYDAVTGFNAVKSAEATRDLQESGVYSSGSARVKSVGSKTFYERDGVWRDNDWSEGGEVTEIKYGSEAYFSLLRQDPGLGRYLSLGTKVEFCVGSQCFSIGDVGEEDEVTVTVTTIESTVPGETSTSIPSGGGGGVLMQTVAILTVLLLIVGVFLFMGRR